MSTTTHHASESENDLYAAIDLGSNSFHMIIARDHHGQMQVIDKHKEMVRLRSGLDKKGYLKESAFEKGIQCLERFGQLIKHIPAKRVRAVGTNTLRNAKNSQAFLKHAKKVLGHEIQIIAGQEEARLIYLGVVQALPPSDEQRLVMDIGGGSTEYIIGQGFTNNHLTSTEMGCVSISQAFFSDNFIDKTRLQNSITHCRQVLRPHYRRLTHLGWDVALGASGSIKAIGAILQENEWSKKGITLKGMQKLSEALMASGRVEDAKIKGLKEERVPVLLGGLAILMATFEELNIDNMQVSSQALREGLIHDSLGRRHSEDVRETSIKAIQKWSNVDTQQAEYVRKTAMALYQQMHNVWQLRNPDYSYQKLLNWACQTHEVGMAMSYRRYRHHSAYLLRNSELAGFSQQEKLMLSIMALNHRGKFHTDAFDELAKPHNEKLKYLTLLLRIAVRVHRGRELEDIEPLIQVDSESVIHLEFDKGWLHNRPLTCMDLESEAEMLKEIGIKLTFS